jgi:hypothetical protein
MDSKSILWIVVAAAAVWFLLRKTESTVKRVNQSVAQTYTAGTAASSVITSVAPALGSFLSNLVGHLGSGGSSSSGGSYAPSGGDDLAVPDFISDGGAFSDDTFDYSG